MQTQSFLHFLKTVGKFLPRQMAIFRENIMFSISKTKKKVLIRNNVLTYFCALEFTWFFQKGMQNHVSPNILELQAQGNCIFDDKYFFGGEICVHYQWRVLLSNTDTGGVANLRFLHKLST